MIRNFIKKRISGDRGASLTIEVIFFTLVIFSTMMTVIDTGLYFNNRYVITNATHNGARLAAVFGGVDRNEISTAYNANDVSSFCNSMNVDKYVTCTVIEELREQSVLTNTQIISVDCGPGKTTRIGENTFCSVRYKYRGLPGSGFTMINLWGESTVKMTSESEVVLK